MVDPWVHAGNLLKSSKKKRAHRSKQNPEVFQYHPRASMAWLQFDPWVHASNLLKSSKISWELTGHGWHSSGYIGN